MSHGFDDGGQLAEFLRSSPDKALTDESAPKALRSLVRLVDLLAGPAPEQALMFAGHHLADQLSFAVEDASTLAQALHAGGWLGLESYKQVVDLDVQMDEIREADEAGHDLWTYDAVADGEQWRSVRELAAAASQALRIGRSDL